MREGNSLAPSVAAPQHRPRPLPLFLAMLRDETAENPEQLSRALDGLAAYQRAERRLRPPPMPVVVQVGRAAVRDYGGTGRPVLFVPSLINPPDVLDISEETSLLRWLSRQGVRPLLVDWGQASAEDRSMSVAGHIEDLLLPMMEALGEPVALAGYCVGGTMAIAAAARRPVESLTLIAVPWHFSGFPPDSRSSLRRLWQRSRPTAEQLGVLPIEALQGSFWRLDPARMVAKFESFAALDPESPVAQAFVALEDWASDGPPLTLAAGRELLEDMFGGDMPGMRTWRVCGDPVDPAKISAPIFDIVSSRDHIVPAASALGMGRNMTLDLGHVGMIVGSRARQALWEPLAEWLSKPDNS
jgi:polyhydroxyalkanoate synthase